MIRRFVSSARATSRAVRPAVDPRTPSLDVDLYSPSTLKTPGPAYAAIRDAGPAVWLPKHRLYALGRYDDVRAALKDAASFVSERGIGVSALPNRLGRLTTISSDGATHATRRKVLLRAVGAKSLAHLGARIEREADDLVCDLLARGGSFDGVQDFATQLPVRIVADLVGLRVPHEQLLDWGRVTFDVLGPMNRRGLTAAPGGLALWSATRRLTRDRVVPDSWASSIFDAADAGEITQAEARTMVIDLVAPSLDTTILATAHLLWHLGTVDGLWELLRADPERIPAAVVESVRLSTPIRGFTRYVPRDTGVDGVTIPGGSRAVLLYAAANHDERHFPDPGTFDLGRRPAANLGWGNGPHTCVGIHLAKMEMQALLRSMVQRVDTIETDTPVLVQSNTLQGLGRLPTRITPAGGVRSALSAVS